MTGHENLRFVGRQGTGGLAGIYMQGTAEGDLGAPEPRMRSFGSGHLYTDTLCLLAEVDQVKDAVRNQPSRFTA